MSRNSSQLPFFSLSAYLDLGPLRFLLFFVLLLLYVLVLFSNVLLIAVVCFNRTLHEPMYVFLCSLLLNELYGSAALFPFLLLHTLRDVHAVPAPFCFLQVFCLHSYGLIEFLFLAVMSYDRYVAICYPLHYSRRMTRNKMAALISVPCCYSFFISGVMISLSSSLELCGNVIQKVYCDNYPIVKLACSDTSSHNVYSLIMVTNNIGLPLLLIFWSYLQIFRVCLSGSKQLRQKALSTCTPHITSLLNYTVGCCFELLQGRFDMRRVPNVFRVFMSLYFLLCQPLFNPLIYGLVLSKIRLMCKSLLLKHTVS